MKWAGGVGFRQRAGREPHNGAECPGFCWLTMPTGALSLVCQALHSSDQRGMDGEKSEAPTPLSPASFFTREGSDLSQAARR